MMRRWLAASFALLFIGTLAIAQSIPFPGPGSYPATAPKVVTFQTSAQDTTDQTTYTYTSQAFGTATSDRCIIVSAATSPTGAGTYRQLSSATIGGVSATILTQTAAGQAAGTTNTSIIIAAVPTGTTGTVALTYAGGLARSAISVWSATGLANCTSSDDAQTTLTAVANIMTLTLNTLGSGFAVGMAGENGDDGATSWTNATSRASSTVEGARYTAADNSSTSLGTLAIAVSPFSDARRSYSAASW